jgi:predicted methyltransferase
MKQTLFMIGLLLMLTVLTSCAETNNRRQIIDVDQHRSANNKARDIYRHPQQTLEFFDVKPNMTVVEIWPGGGWYSEILAPYLHDDGVLYAAHFAADSTVAYFTRNLKQFIEKTTAQPKIYGKMIVTELDPPAKIEIAPAGSADRVLTFRNVHNWMKSGQVDTVFKAMYRALKPGGILGIVEHRAALDTEEEQDPYAKSGYVKQSYVIQLAETAGFKLVGQSEINANPSDTKNYPAGVWTLPPSLRLNDNNTAKYMAIGESDRMTLKFVKPK